MLTYIIIIIAVCVAVVLIMRLIMDSPPKAKKPISKPSNQVGNKKPADGKSY